MSDVHDIEFLDLTDVDENEQIRVRTSLMQNDSSVQLPWIKHNQKLPNPGIKQIKKKKLVRPNESVRNDTAHHAYHNFLPSISSDPAISNLYLGQDQQFRQPAVVMSPLVTHWSNLDYFGKTVSQVSSTYPQQVYVIPASTPSNVIQGYPTTAYPYAVTTQPIQIHDDVTKPFVGLLEPASQQQDYGNGNIPSSTNHLPNVSPNCSTKVNSATPLINQPLLATVNNNISHEIQPLPSTHLINPSVVVQNGIIKNKPVKEVTTTSPPTNKSWASLFNANKTNNDVSTQPFNDKMDKTIYEKTANNELNNHKSICPIKHPRRSQFIDPDCYRMGEYLINHSIDGRAISLQPRGLINQSNYCYINSILQALVACPPLYNLLCGLSQNISSNEKRKPTPVIDGMCRFVKEFKHLPANMRVSNRRSDCKNQKKEQGIMINTDIPFEPSWIYKMLNGIRTDLIEGRQEDAEEFLGCLLNGLNDEMLELIKLIKSDCDGVQQNATNSEKDDLDKEWQVMGPKNKGSVTRRTDFGRTPISDIFGGFLKSKIHRTGDHVTENIQPFFTLQLNIEKVKTVREALEALVTKYQLEGVTSSKTNEQVEAWQQVTLDELPVILVLHLKCFDFKLDGCTKIIKALEFPVDLKIDSKLLSSKTQTPKEKQYKLFAVVYHDGKEATKGHYVTDAFHVGYSSWLRYDDASVKAVQEEHVLNPQGTRVPYLLFYRRSDTIRSK